MGSVFFNFMFDFSSELVAIPVCGFLYKRLKMRALFSILFALTATGAILMEIFPMNGRLMPVLIVITKFGLSGALCTLTNSTTDVFPAMFAATALGICNFSARVLVSMSPFIAAIQNPIPMWVLTAISILALIVVQFVRRPQQNLCLGQIRPKE